MIFARPAPVRMTHLGVSSTPNPLLEAVEAFGATRTQILFTIELPSAMPTGCRFLERCGYAQSGCKSDQPLAEIEPGRLARCSRAADIELPGATA